jgi:hypothetical protein
LLQDLLGEKVAHACAVLQRLKVRGLQQLLLAVVQRLMNGLLHAGIVQLALAGRLARKQLEDGVAGDLVSGSYSGITSVNCPGLSLLIAS